MGEPLDPVFKALADPSRRRILDLLRHGPLTTGGVARRFDEMTRFGVMKHLSVLEEAGLITVRREGRRRWNHLNAVPIRRLYERWVSRYAEFWSSSLLRLQETAEEKESEDGEEERG